MRIVVCPSCSTRVVALPDSSCPSCRELIPADTPAVEPATDLSHWPVERSPDDAWEPSFDGRLVDQHNIDVLRDIHLKNLKLSRRYRRTADILVIAGFLMLGCAWA